jgi:hypothetical protein
MEIDENDYAAILKNNLWLLWDSQKYQYCKSRPAVIQSS